jgi:transcriptional regulator
MRYKDMQYVNSLLDMSNLTTPKISTLYNLTKTEVSNIEKTEVSNIEKTEVSNIEKTEVSNIEKTAVSNIEKAIIRAPSKKLGNTKRIIDFYTKNSIL